MIDKLPKDEIWDLIGFVKISPHRRQTLKALEKDYLMPSEIARLTGIRTTQASSALIDLKSKELVVCMNESAHKGRIYMITELGLDLVHLIEKKQP